MNKLEQIRLDPDYEGAAVTLRKYYDHWDLLDTKLIDLSLQVARDHPRKRFIFRVHLDGKIIEDSRGKHKLKTDQHLMINALTGNTYITPHRHDEKVKSEHFRALRGKAAVVFFDDEGKITNVITISNEPDSRKLVTIRPGKWHTIIPLSSEFVMLEQKRQPVVYRDDTTGEFEGGYNPKTDKVFPDWAPIEPRILSNKNKPDGYEDQMKKCKSYLQSIFDRIMESGKI